MGVAVWVLVAVIVHEAVAVGVSVGVYVAVAVGVAEGVDVGDVRVTLSAWASGPWRVLLPRNAMFS